MFYKIASVPILGVYQSSGKFTKCASKTGDLSKEDDAKVQHALNLISKDMLTALGSIYNISTSIDDYIFPVPRATGVDYPNNNGDNFSHDEMTRFSPRHRCMVYQTFRNDPIHIEHAAFDPKAARGFIPDVNYIFDDPKDKYVLAITAIDTKKDGPLAEGMLSGDIDKFSMGCVCDSVKCSYSKCGKVAHSDSDLCDHLLWYKMSKIDGELIYEDCQGVEFNELSVVGDPAYEKATTQYLLQVEADRKIRDDAISTFNVISSLMNSEDQLEVAKYFKENVNRLPNAMLRLANKIL